MSGRVFVKYFQKQLAIDLLFKSNRNITRNSRLLTAASNPELKTPDTMTTNNTNETTYTYDQAVIKGRNADHSIHPLILSRTSPREMTGQLLSDGELMTLFEAARWAPSFYNQQPWRFAYAKRNTDNYAKFESLVWPLNLQWCREASALVVVASHKLFYMKGDNTKELPNPTHSFDAGAACMALALEANARDLVVHCMAGFDYQKAYEVFGVDQQRYNIDCMIAIGRRPEPNLRPHEPRVSPRNALNTFVSEGSFRPVPVQRNESKIEEIQDRYSKT
ncbi:unnamed protein product [Medioppia subpectinata]|uniref:Nitroreductase domain-containing protein n=1 Tax=Medioppia subpectinata TaxID=1979941 RepID=A0A7R9PT96_9ACAR|nr:unnamed protein product [Medioppia subpectinata]CAG2100413.1 unnamed protein product [Medioppia subpectinata]